MSMVEPNISTGTWAVRYPALAGRVLGAAVGLPLVVPAPVKTVTTDMVVWVPGLPEAEAVVYVAVRLA